MSQQPGSPARFERSPKRVRTYLGGALAADTLRPLLVWENPYFPSYYIPAADVTADLIPAGQGEPTKLLGAADVFDVRAGAVTSARAARRYPGAPTAEIADAIRFEWSAMSEWLEEDEPVYTHPRSPYTRVDILASSRRVRVDLDGVTIAESGQPRILYETGLPPRYYLPLTDIRMDLLRPSPTVSHCPYKGTASYWSVDTGTRTHDDVVWMYRTPLPECSKIAGLACFYTEKVDLFVDGAAQSRPGR
ncbi:MAG: DUF427 domain-containing protein [Streptosporangiaceae bacterium]